MGIKSSNGQSSVNLPGMDPNANPNTGIKVISGMGIVHKAINRHHANPGFKKGK